MTILHETSETTFDRIVSKAQVFVRADHVINVAGRWYARPDCLDNDCLKL